MVTEPRDYGPLQETHSKVQEILSSRDRQDHEPANARETQEQTSVRHEPRDYGPLKETHEKVAELLNSRNPQEQQSTRVHEADETRAQHGPEPLRETHRKVQEILGSRGQDQQPTHTREADGPTATRPVDQPVRSPGSPDGPGRFEMEMWAIAQNNYNNAKLRQDTAAEMTTSGGFHERHSGLTLDDTRGPEQGQENEQERGAPRDGRNR